MSYFVQSGFVQWMRKFIKKILLHAQIIYKKKWNVENFYTNIVKKQKIYKDYDYLVCQNKKK